MRTCCFGPTRTNHADMRRYTGMLLSRHGPTWPGAPRLSKPPRRGRAPDDGEEVVDVGRALHHDDHQRDGRPLPPPPPHHPPSSHPNRPPPFSTLTPSLGSPSGASPRRLSLSRAVLDVHAILPAAPRPPSIPRPARQAPQGPLRGSGPRTFTSHTRARVSPRCIRPRRPKRRTLIELGALRKQQSPAALDKLRR